MLKPLELHPRDYLVYAYNALTRVTELLMEQQEERVELRRRQSVDSNGAFVWRGAVFVIIDVAFGGRLGSDATVRPPGDARGESEGNL